MKKSYTWPVVIILLIAFFPVGFYLLYKRFSCDKTATAKNQKGLSVSGWIFIGIAALYFIMGISGEIKNEDGSASYSEMLIVLLVFLLLGMFFLKTAAKFKKMGEKSKKYISIILRQNITTIENIASSAGVSYEQVVNDLQEMLDNGYFPGAYINEQNHQFVLSSNNPVGGQISNAATQTKVAKCQNCGANNKVFIERSNQCEYCSSPIEI